MKILPLILIAVITITVLLPQGCTKDVLVVTNTCSETDIVGYDDVRGILNSSCGAASTQCHIPGGTFPDYTSLNDGMRSSLNFERFENQVIINRSMPQVGSPQLDSIQFRKIKCWVEGGYVE